MEWTGGHRTDRRLLGRAGGSWWPQVEGAPAGGNRWGRRPGPSGSCPCLAVVIPQGQLCSRHTEPGPLSIWPLPLRAARQAGVGHPSHTRPPRPLQVLGTVPHTPQDRGVRARGLGEAVCRRPWQPCRCRPPSCSLSSLCPTLRFPRHCLCLFASLCL